jgi:hypothetical protein
VLKVYKLSKEKTFVDEATRPLEIEYLNALADAEVTTVSQKESRKLIFHVNAQL